MTEYARGLAHEPTLKPERPFFSSGPTAKFPGWSLDTPTLAITAHVLSQRALSVDIIELVLQPTQPLEVRAGQYVRFCLDNGDSRCFSIANLPAQDQGRLVVHMRKVSGGRFTERVLPALHGLLVMEGAAAQQPGVMASAA